ncbi:tripartite motif-containing protein 3-like [Patiria miniata]|uniref:RING-type domain-containing protein n=1 Tax=Patiria miniata TaxID=46514 RepID=A0A914BKM4_PATMI|nr:tripartite motif-containing protein 3-like [Patiria miniata]
MAEGGRYRSSLREFGEKHLQCSICHDWYKNPKTLTCLHSFCKECFMGCHGSSSVTSCVKCPVCRKVTYIGEDNISDLLTDFKLAGMVEAVTKEPVDEEQTCSDHVGKVCCGFCFTCDQVICFLCLKDSHNAHEVGEVGEVVEIRKEYVKERPMKCEKSLEDVAKARKMVSKMEKDCRSTIGVIRQSVESRAVEEIARVTAAKQRIMDELNKIQNDRMKLLSKSARKLDSEEEDLRKIIKNSKVVIAVRNDYNFLKKYTKWEGDFAHYPNPDVKHIAPLSVGFYPSSKSRGRVDLGTLRNPDIGRDEDDSCVGTVIPNHDDDDKYSSEIYKNVKKWRGNWPRDNV